VESGACRNARLCAVDVILSEAKNLTPFHKAVEKNQILRFAQNDRHVSFQNEERVEFQKDETVESVECWPQAIEKRRNEDGGGIHDEPSQRAAG